MKMLLTIVLMSCIVSAEEFSSQNNQDKPGDMPLDFHRLKKGSGFFDNSFLIMALDDPFIKKLTIENQPLLGTQKSSYNEFYLRHENGRNQFDDHLIFLANLISEVQTAEVLAEMLAKSKLDNKEITKYNLREFIRQKTKYMFTHIIRNLPEELIYQQLPSIAELADSLVEEFKKPSLEKNVEAAMPKINEEFIFSL